MGALIWWIIRVVGARSRGLGPSGTTTRSASLIALITSVLGRAGVSTRMYSAPSCEGVRKFVCEALI